MRYFTKEWYSLMDSLGTAEMFEPVIDKDYTDEEIENLYQDMMEKYVQEERDSYDEPPCMVIDPEDMIDEEDFDPEDYLVGEIDEDGEEENLHHPESLAELLEFQQAELEYAIREYENRPPFDEEEARSEFEENYNDYLEEPDEDVPQWIRDSVDIRLLAMGAMPESVYKKLMAEEEENQARFDELDAIADEAMEDMYAELPDEYIDLQDDLDEMDGDYVVDVVREDGDVEIILSGWDEEGDPVQRKIILEEASVLEDEGLDIEAEIDEDGDYLSNCDLLYHEVYFENDRFEVHFLFENEGLKYMTIACSLITIEQGLHRLLDN